MSELLRDMEYLYILFLYIYKKNDPKIWLIKIIKNILTSQNNHSKHSKSRAPMSKILDTQVGQKFEI